MRYIVVILCTVLLHSPSKAQINQKIDISDVEVWIGPHQEGVRPFIGSFEFQTLPAPLEPTRIHFVLEVSSDARYLPKGDWEIHLRYHPKTMRLIGESVFVWPPPHPIGATYSGSFEVVPLGSSQRNIAVYMPGYGRNLALTITWCLDPDGNLTFLGTPDDRPRCDHTICTFFSPNSVHVVQSYAKPVPEQLFRYSYTVIPPFRIGDTSTITYTLTAVNDAPHGVDIEIMASGMQIVSLPEPITTPVLPGETVQLQMRVVPQPITGIRGVTILLSSNAKAPPSARQSVIPCEAVFHDNGDLRFVSDIDLSTIDKDLLPKTFRKARSGDNETVRISKEDGKIKRRVY
jgi:hypothetical protein